MHFLSKLSYIRAREVLRVKIDKIPVVDKFYLSNHCDYGVLLVRIAHVIASGVSVIQVFVLR